MTKRNGTNDILAALKAARKKSREDEIAAHGKPINYSSITKSKKQYTRKIKHKGTRLSTE